MSSSRVHYWGGFVRKSFELQDRLKSKKEIHSFNIHASGGSSPLMIPVEEISIRKKELY